MTNEGRCTSHESVFSLGKVGIGLSAFFLKREFLEEILDRIASNDIHDNSSQNTNRLHEGTKHIDNAIEFVALETSGTMHNLHEAWRSML